MPAHSARRRPEGIRRSVRLFRAFLTEQSDPDGFYSLLADDCVDLLRPQVDLTGALVADFGGGPGFYSEAFRRAGARTVLIDADDREIRLHGRTPTGAVVGRAERAPLADSSVDVCFSSNLLEHVADFDAVADELARVVRPGGLLVVSYTVWLGPWGGHETSPWHYLGGRRAARRYQRRHGHPPKNAYGESMFAASAADGLRWVHARADLVVLDLRPRYLPPWAAPVLRLPGLREVVTWNLWLVARKVDSIEATYDTGIAT